MTFMELSVLKFLYSDCFPSLLVAFIVTRYKSKELTRKQSQQLELLEYEIRKEIREGRYKEIYSASVYSVISDF